MTASRYTFLDGIRGLAAIFVVTRHTTDLWEFSFFRSYLAVDLFFILSGFVIANAYEEKLSSKSISTKSFIIIRLIRLYPIYLLSLLICSILYLANITDTQNSSGTTSNLILSIALATAMLPSKIPGSPSLFPMNGPYWSLFFELIINLVYAAIRPILSRNILVALIAIFGILVSGASLLRGDLDVGHTWGTGSIAAGFSRAGFGVFLGVFIFRNIDSFAMRFQRIKFPWIATILAIGILASPSFGRLDPIIDIISVIAIFPMLLIVASQGKSSKAEKILTTLGSASYPIYVLHLPLGLIFSSYLKEQGIQIAPTSGIIFLIILIPIALASEKIYDIPVRKWLINKFIKNNPHHSSHPQKIKQEESVNLN
ncbi:acyltransferase [Malikia sp.]|uniref:acyltransferase family protein n=1 Tax=Malikia sp. TaxID=2070706 RepID=UPI0026387665|nr:acyltransferase [Malikia sp.]MDD2728584.1 acyltransferase [Malikia sp.]